VPPQGGRKHPHQEFTPVDTTQTFSHFGGGVRWLRKPSNGASGKNRWAPHRCAAFHRATPQYRDARAREPTDLIRYGLIPEFCPGACRWSEVLGDLDKGALMQILTEPKTLSSVNINGCSSLRIAFAVRRRALETVATWPCSAR